jgi:hypothetical protein
MGAIRTCCGWYCSLIALIAIPFFIICIALEAQHNQFMMWRLNMPYMKINGTTSVKELEYQVIGTNATGPAQHFITYEKVDEY